MSLRQYLILGHLYFEHASFVLSVADPCDAFPLPVGRQAILFDVGAREEIPDKGDRGGQAEYSSCKSSFKSIKDFFGSQGNG